MNTYDEIADGSHGSYQEQHIQFVTTEHGTSIIEILLLLYSITLLPLLTSLLIPWFVPPNFNKYTKYSPRSVSFTRILMEFLVIVTTSVLIITVLAGSNVIKEPEHNDLLLHEDEGGSLEDEDSLSFYGINSLQCVAVTLTFMCMGMMVLNEIGRASCRERV